MPREYLKEVLVLSACYVGIDVSKDTASAQGLSPEGKKLFFIEFSMNAEGFSKLMSAVQSSCKDLSKVTAAMESTGCYHTNLFCFLSDKIQCFVINPLLIANFSKLSLRKTKTDKKDALTIAQFLLLHKDSLSKAAPAQGLQDIKDLAREKESLTWLIAGLKNDIKRMLQITFPELESFCKQLFTETMRDFLKQFPSARTVRAAKRNSIVKALVHADGRKRVIGDPDELIGLAKSSVASGSAAKELILPEKIATLDHLIEQRERISEALVEACQALMIEDIEIITSIGGISDATASSFLAEVGDYKAFPSYKHLIAFVGLDPSVRQSGKFEGKSRISKRGNRHLRHLIYLMTSCVVRGDNIFRAYYLRRRTEGLPFKKAILATAHKLLRVIFSMLQSKKPFEARG